MRLAAGTQQAGLLEQQRQFEQVGDAVGLRDDAVGQRRGAVALAQLAGREEDGQFAASLLGVVEIGRMERARRRHFLDQQADAVNLGKCLVIGATPGTGEEFGNAAGMDFGILAQVDWRQMEAEDLHCPQQAAQAAAGEAGAAVLLERGGQHLEVGAQFGRGGVGFGLADFMAHRLDAVECAGGRGDTRINTRQRATVRLVVPLRRVVGGPCCQVVELGRGPDQQAGERQFAAEFVNFVKIVIEHGRRLQAQRFPQDVGSDERVAVAVAADPGADAEERR